MSPATVAVRPAAREVGLPDLAARTRALLEAGVPLTLLLDLGEAGAPRSAARYRSEGGQDAAWLRRRSA